MLTARQIKEREKEKVAVMTPAGLEIGNIPNLKRRQLAVYVRPITKDGVTTWIETRPLPADGQSRAAYFAKGFRMEAPSDKEVRAVDTEKDALLEENARLRAELETKRRGRRVA